MSFLISKLTTMVRLSKTVPPSEIALIVNLGKLELFNRFPTRYDDFKKQWLDNMYKALQLYNTY